MESEGVDSRTKKCPTCAEIIKLEALKCRFCGHEFDQKEIDTQLKSINEMEEKGKKQCPTCKKWDVYKAYTEDGSFGDWCPNCKKSILSQTKTQQVKRSSICFIIALCSFIFALLTPKLFASFPFLIATIFGFISFFRGELLKWLSLTISILSILMAIFIQTELNKISTDLQKIGTNLSPSIEKQDPSYLIFLEIEKIDFQMGYGGGHATFVARVRNKGDKIVNRIKANVEVYDKNRKVVHSTTIHDFGDIYPNSAKEISTFSRVPRDGKSCSIFITEAYVKDKTY